MRCRDGKQDQLKLGVPLGGSREGAFTGRSWGKDFGNLCRCRDTAPPVLVGLEQGIRSFACTLLMENTSRPRPVCAAAVPVCPPRPLASLVAVVGVGSGSGLGEWLCSPGLPVSPEGTSGQAVGAPCAPQSHAAPCPGQTALAPAASRLRTRLWRPSAHDILSPRFYLDLASRKFAQVKTQHALPEHWDASASSGDLGWRQAGERDLQLEAG